MKYAHQVIAKTFYQLIRSAYELVSDDTSVVKTESRF